VLVAIVFRSSQADAGHNVHLGHSVSWSHRDCSGGGTAYANDDSIGKERLKWHTHVGNRTMDELIQAIKQDTVESGGGIGEFASRKLVGRSPRAAEGTRAVALNGIAAWRTLISWHDQSAAHPALLTAREAIRGLSALEKRAKSVLHWFTFEFTRSKTCYCCRTAWISVGTLRFDRGALELLSWTCATNRNATRLCESVLFHCPHHSDTGFIENSRRISAT
jgi:hypothetical protein